LRNSADVKGVILSGSPFSVNDREAFKPDMTLIRGKYPLLGICYGAQYLAWLSKGKVEKGDSREYGPCPF
jgi:GMP synthase (glutamine-hydrolysing)